MAMSKKNRKFRENKNTRKRESWIKDNKKSVITEDFICGYCGEKFSDDIVVPEKKNDIPRIVKCPICGNPQSISGSYK